jgi:tetratricopeptide (TPR) repeat protein
MFLPATADALDCGQTAYDCGLYYVSRNDFPRAISYLGETLKRSPGDLRAHNLLGIALTGSGQIDEANREFEKALELNPGFYPALKNLAVNELTLKQTREAKAHLEEVLKFAPDDELTHVSLGEIFFAEKQCQPALEHYEKGRRRVVHDSDLILHYSQCAFEQGQRKSAETMLDLLPADDAAAEFQAGMMLGRADATVEAAIHFGRARKGYADPYQAGFNQLLMQIKGRDFQGGIRTAEELLSQGYQRAELYNLLSEAYLKSGQLQESLQALRKAAQIDPTDERNYLDLAALCENFGNYDLGIQITDIGIRNIPGSFRLYLQRGAIRAGKTELTEAQKDFVSAQTLAPGEPLPYVALAITWMLQGQIPKAVALLRERAKLTPKDFLTHYMLGIALVRSAPEAGSQDEIEALRAFETSIRLNPGYAHAHTQLGKMLLKRGDKDQAIEELEKAIALDPAEEAATFQLAQAYHKKGNQVRSSELKERFAKLHVQEREDEDAKMLKHIVAQGTLAAVPAQSESARPAEFHRQQGILYFSQHDLQKALGEFRSAVELNPSDAESHDYIGVLLGELGSVAAAIPEFQKALELNPRFSLAHYHLALAYYRTGQTREAVAHYQEALRLKPDFSDAKYGLSEVCSKLGDRAGAIRLLRELINADPNSVEARYSLALELWRGYSESTGLRNKQDLEEAVQHLQAARQLQPQQPQVLFALGEILAEKEDLSGAVEALAKAVELAPHNPEFHYNYALALRMKGDTETAEREVRETLRLNPKHVLARRTLGLLLRQKGDFQSALTELRAGATERPDDAEIRHTLGTVLLRLDDLNGAIEELRQATRLNPYLSEAYLILAQALQKAGRGDEASQARMEGQRIDKLRASVGRAMVLVQSAVDSRTKGDTAAALSALREAVTLSPDFSEAYYQLALTLRESNGNKAEIESALGRVLELKPDYAAAHYQMGLAWQDQGQQALAQVEFRRAVELAPSFVQARRALGEVALFSEDWQTAVEQFRGLLFWNPDDAEAHQALGRALIAQQRWDEAIQESRAATVLKEDLAEAHYDLGIALKARGEVPEAELEFRIAHRLDPNLPVP